MSFVNEKYYPWIIFLFSVLLYSNTLKHNYSFDDKLVVTLHEPVQKGISAIPDIFSSYYVNGVKENFEYRPLTRASFAIEYQFFGKNPALSHLVNILLSALTCLLLYGLVSKLFPAQGKIFAFLAALFFAVHPAHTEVVASLKNREELFSFLFCLLSVYFFSGMSRQGKYPYFIVGIVFFVLSLFTKLSSLPFLLIIPLWLYFSGEGKLKFPVIVFASLSVVIILFMYLVNYMLPGVYDREVMFIENPISAEKSPYIIVLNSFQTFWIYLKLYIFPHPLSFYYGYNMFPVPKKINPEIFLSILILVSLLIYIVLNFRKRSVIVFALLFFLLNISMYINLVFPVPGIIADRALYVSSFGFSLFIAFWIKRFSPMNTMLVSLFLLIPAACKTVVRNSQWKDNYTLISHDLEHLNQSVKANTEFASLWKNRYENEKNSEEKGRQAEKAVFYYRESLRIKPDMAAPYNEIGKIMINYYQNYTEAKANFKRAYELYGEDAEYSFNLGTACAILGELAEAEKYFLNCIRIEDGYTRAMHNLFLVYMNQERFEDAFAINTRLMQKDKSGPHAFVNFGKYYKARGNMQEARKYFEKALSFDPGNNDILRELIIMDKNQGN